MTARDRLIEALKSPGLVGLRDEEADDLVADFAHELAEQQRAEGDSWGQRSAARKAYRAAADLIDPFISAGPARTDEETAT